jgi:hypothetical protein
MYLGEKDFRYNVKGSFTMRKLISLGLLALLLGFLSNAAFAGNVDECEFLKDKSQPGYVPGLYGLCVAWYNASANGDQQAIDEIAAKYFEKSGGDTLPISGDPVGGDEPVFTCLCWTDLTVTHLCALGAVSKDFTTPHSTEPDTYSGTVLFQSEYFGTDYSSCARIFPADGVTIALPINNEIDGLVCGFELGIIKSYQLEGGCPPPSGG